MDVHYFLHCIFAENEMYSHVKLLALSGLLFCLLSQVNVAMTQTKAS